jgi:hypothetical protein
MGSIKEVAKEGASPARSLDNNGKRDESENHQAESKRSVFDAVDVIGPFDVRNSVSTIDLGAVNSVVDGVGVVLPGITTIGEVWLLSKNEDFKEEVKTLAHGDEVHPAKEPVEVPAAAERGVASLDALDSEVNEEPGGEDAPHEVPASLEPIILIAAVKCLSELQAAHKENPTEVSGTDLEKIARQFDGLLTIEPRIKIDGIFRPTR